MSVCTKNACSQAATIHHNPKGKEARLLPDLHLNFPLKGLSR
jgi:hypothetical protein